MEQKNVFPVKNFKVGVIDLDQITSLPDKLKAWVIEMDQNSEASDDRIVRASRPRLSVLRRRARRARVRARVRSDQTLKNGAHQSAIRDRYAGKINQVEISHLRDLGSSSPSSTFTRQSARAIRSTVEERCAPVATVVATRGS